MTKKSIQFKYEICRLRVEKINQILDLLSKKNFIYWLKMKAFIAVR